MQKINSFHQFIPEIQAILESRHPTGHTHFWRQPKKFLINFYLCKFISTCKRSRYFINLFWRYGWLKNPAIWLAENILAHISGMCRNTANYYHNYHSDYIFHHRTNSVKIIDKIFQYILAHFWSVFPILGAKRIFLENPGLSRKSYRFLAPCQNLEETNDTIPRKCPERRMNGRTGGRTDPNS